VRIAIRKKLGLSKSRCGGNFSVYWGFVVNGCKDSVSQGGYSGSSSPLFGVKREVSVRLSGVAGLAVGGGLQLSILMVTLLGKESWELPGARPDANM